MFVPAPLLPVKLIIGPSIWKVEFVDRFLGTNSAEVSYEEGTIYISTRAPRSRWFALLIHEVLEVLDIQYADGLGLSHAQKCVLGEALAEFFLLNGDDILDFFEPEAGDDGEDIGGSTSDA